MLTAAPDPSADAIDAQDIRLLNWNIKKGSLPHWSRDLAQFSQQQDLVLIQEARESMAVLLRSSDMDYMAFAPGYHSSLGPTGVATFSRAAPLGSCHLVAYEPWLRSPKATSITRFQLQDTEASLVVVNIHMINFTFGQSAFRQQLQQVVDLLSNHRGPLIISGDFNTWRPARQQLLDQLMAHLQLQAVTFETDKRTRFFDHPLDHVYIGGFSVRQAETRVVSSSDHNPLVMRLASIL